MVLMISQEEGQNVVIFQCPAIGDIIAMDVCTPIQVFSISRALIDRLQPAVSNSFKMPLVLAGLYHRLDKQEAIKKALWRQGYGAFLEHSAGWAQEEADRWKELIADEIEGAGYTSFEILGEELCYPRFNVKSLDLRLQLLWFYQVPVSFGPMGHSLAVISSNTFHEYGAFRGETKEAIQKLHTATASASIRYLKELSVLETYLTENGLGISSEESEDERLMIELISRPAERDSDVVMKAIMILDEY
jgi:hypothetical protein